MRCHALRRSRLRLDALRLAFLLTVLGITSPLRAEALDVVGVRTASTAQEGATLTLPRYDVPTDGLLVVRLGARGASSRSVRFDGEEMIHASSLEVSYFATLSAELFYLPVAAGASGPIEVAWSHDGTDQRALIAATVEGATDLAFARVYTGGEVRQDGRTGPNTAAATISSGGPAAILSAVTVFGSGIPESLGGTHVLDAHPTVPESRFHEVKVQGGHVLTTGPGDHTVGFQNTRPTGYMDYAMVVASFTRVPEPSLGTGLLFGALALATRGRRAQGKNAASFGSVASSGGSGIGSTRK
ncbi:MAG: hypothetical protein AAGC67_04585 [Myxococcota bacterium]